jgi:chromosome segregation ATPase
LSRQSRITSMFGQDERTDELQVASRERLLTEIGVLQFALKSNQLEATKQELQATKQELQATKQELLAACDAVYGSSAELGELRVQLNVAKEKLRRAQNRNKLIVNSATWKLGHLLMAPRRILLRVFNISGK